MFFLKKNQVSTSCQTVKQFCSLTFFIFLSRFLSSSSLSLSDELESDEELESLLDELLSLLDESDDDDEEEESLQNEQQKLILGCETFIRWLPGEGGGEGRGEVIH